MNVSCGCFAGSEAAFDGLRCAWSEAAGYGIHDFRNQGGPVVPRIDFAHFSEEDLCGEWPDGAPDDPLLILLVHHEKVGRIKWQHAPLLADRLEQLESLFMKQHKPSTVILMTQQFVHGLRTAASYKEDVQFS